MKKCKICKQLKKENNFYIAYRGKKGQKYLDSYCKKCSGNQAGLRKKKRQFNKKNELFNKLGNKCKKCGIMDKRVLEFNHKDFKLKNRELLNNRKRYASAIRRFKIYEKELKNLELLCANCHRIHNYKTIWKNKYKIKY